MSGETASKLLGYAMIGPANTETPVSKLLGYAMISLAPIPRRRVQTRLLTYPHK